MHVSLRVNLQGLNMLAATYQHVGITDTRVQSLDILAAENSTRSKIGLHTAAKPGRCCSWPLALHLARQRLAQDTCPWRDWIEMQ